MAQCCKDFWLQLLITLILSSWIQDHDQLQASFLVEPTFLLVLSTLFFDSYHFSSANPYNIYYEEKIPEKLLNR